MLWIRIYGFVRVQVTVLLVALAAQMAYAEPITIAIEDKNWAPYYTWVDGKPRGPCPEIAAGAIRHMGAELEFVRVPWVRVLREVQSGSVDAGLCGTKTDERAAYSHYPDEPLLSYDATLFVRSNSPLQSSDAAIKENMTFGLVSGYNYGGIDEALEAQGMVRLDATSREALLQQLAKGRIDAVLDSVLPTVAEARRLGLQSQLRPLYPSLSETPAYLFFSRREGNERLAAEFSTALTEFKKTDEYRVIKERYGF